MKRLRIRQKSPDPQRFSLKRNRMKRDECSQRRTVPVLYRTGTVPYRRYLDSSDDFKLCGGPEVDALFSQEEAQISRDVTTRHVHAHNAVRHGETLVDRHLNSMVNVPFQSKKYLIHTPTEIKQNFIEKNQITMKVKY